MEAKSYIPKPIDTSNVKLPRDLYPLVEELSKNTHEVWASHRLQEGWQYGKERNEELKTTPCLVEYEELPEIEKDYDRNTSIETLKTIQTLGFSIIKKTIGEIMIVGDYNSEALSKFTKESKRYNLSLSHFDNWDSAKEQLSKNLLKWHAIILDVQGKMDNTAPCSSLFLRNAIDDINTIFNRKRNEIPWYISPSKCDGNTDTIIKYTVGRERKNKDWGNYLYCSNEIDKLFEKINMLLPDIPNFRIRNVYDDVFNALNSFFPDTVTDLLFSVLQPLHSPEIFFSFDPTQNYDNVRRTLEAFFITSCNYMLIPTDVCHDHSNGSVNLRGCVEYMKSGEGKRVFPVSIALLAEGILNRTNPGCHFGSEDQLQGLYYSVMSLSLQLCDIIVWIGNYINSNNCKSIFHLIPEYKGKLIKISRDVNGNYYYGKCIIKRTTWVEDKFNRNINVVISEVYENKHYTKKTYPLLAEIKLPNR